MTEADGLRAQATEILSDFSKAQVLMQQARDLIDQSVGAILTMSMFKPSGLRGAMMMTRESSAELERAQMTLANSYEELHHYRDRL